MTNLNVETNELSIDELEAISGGAKVGVLNTIASTLCEVAGDLAKGVGANGAAYTLYTTAEGLLH
jgi:bacteriocin-like protein